MTTIINGSCHCGNICFELTWPEDTPLVGVRECGCSFCQKHGGAWTSNQQGELDVQINDGDLVSKYQFGTATADFYICSRCGVVPLVISDIEDHLYAVVNVNTFSENPKVSFSHSITDFEGEETGSRLERRQRNWIPIVRL